MMFAPLNALTLTSSILLPSMMAAAAILLWWITRRKQQRHWLPILRVLNVKRHVVFRRVIATPPWLPWLLFIVLSLLFVILSGRPYLENHIDNPLGRQRAIFLVDLSASVFVHQSATDLLQMLRSKASEFETVVFVGADSTLLSWASFDLEDQKLKQENRRFADFFPQDLGVLQDFDQLVIFTDLDRYTWQGFHYPLIAKKIAVKIQDLKTKERPKNVFINRITDEHMEIRRVGSLDQALILDEQGNKHSVSFSSDTDAVLMGRLYGKVQIQAEDDLKDDNVIELPAKTKQISVDLVAPVLSERLIDEPVYHLAKIMESLGFSVELHEKEPKVYQAIVSYGICPKGPANSNAQMSWYIPLEDYSVACRCLVASVGSSFQGCSEVESRGDWISLMQSIGLKQVGGAAGDIQEALAFRKDHRLFFTLDPAAVLGVSRFALAMRSLLLAEGVLKNAQHDWSPPIPRGESELVSRDVDIEAISSQEKKSEASALVIPLIAAMLIVLSLDVAASVWFLVLMFILFPTVHAQTQLHLLSPYSKSIHGLSKMVESRTSIELHGEAKIVSDLSGSPWLWLRQGEWPKLAHSKKEVLGWLLKGGLLVLESGQTIDGLDWQDVAMGHELMQSYYLLKQLPSCDAQPWRVASKADGQIIALSIPFAFLDAILGSPPCDMKKEDLNRSFVNLLMVAMTLDYKKDQIHLPEILKRIR